MACSSCNGTTKRKQFLSATAVAPSAGGYPLMMFAACTQLYRGPHEGDSIYVVGRGTKAEKLFLRAALGDASDYGKQTRQTIENIPTTALCQQAIEQVYQEASL